MKKKKVLYIGILIDSWGLKLVPTPFNYLILKCNFSRLYIEWSLNTRVYMGELMSDIVMNIIAEPEFLIVDVRNYFIIILLLCMYIRKMQPGTAFLTKAE